MSLFRLLVPGCPNCDGEMVGYLGEPVRMSRANFETGEDFDLCRRCGAVVSYRVFGWRFAGETGFRPLPGILSLLFRGPKAPVAGVKSAA